MKKLLAIMLCLLTVLGATSCVNQTADDPYDEIIETYRELMYCKRDGSELPTQNDAKEKATTAVLYAIAESCEDPYAMGYARKDLNGDGTEELVLLGYTSVLFAVYTQVDGTPVLVESFEREGDHGIIKDSTTIYKYGKQSDYPAGDYYRVIQLLRDGSLSVTEYGLHSEKELDKATEEDITYYKSVNGEYTEISKQEYLVFQNSEINRIFLQGRKLTKDVGLRCLPAIEEGRVADFSSYDSILSMYQKIVCTFSDYTLESWINGNYDNLYVFKNNASYEVFHSVFNAGIHFRPSEVYQSQSSTINGNNAYCYTKKDLNKDGIEELILLTDSYDILAIFTEKDGKAVLLDSYSPSSAAWIDENGRIHVSRETGGLTGRDCEYYLYEVANGELKCLFGIGYQMNLYLQREGWYRLEDREQVRISEEEWNVLYEQYNLLPDSFQIEEYTKSYANLNVLPLFESTKAENTHVGIWKNIIIGDSLAIQHTSSTAVTFLYVKCVEISESENSGTTIKISATATLEDGVYRFDSEDFCGSLEFGAECIWLTVTKSDYPEIECRSYLFDLK